MTHALLLHLKNDNCNRTTT